jgi:RIO kinase 1
MEYVGDEERAAPELRHVKLEDPEGFLDLVLDAAAVLFSKAKLVHGDLSEFNILVHDDRPVLIDLGQAMLLRHPRSPELLERDCKNVVRYWKRLGVDVDVATVRERITAGGTGRPQRE